MPHVIVKLWPGKSEKQKTHLAEEIAKDVMTILNYGEESVSVAFEEVKSQDWAEKVYKPLRIQCCSVPRSARFHDNLRFADQLEVMRYRKQQNGRVVV